MITCSCLMTKVDDGLPSPTSSDCMCWPRAMMAYQVRCSLTVYVVQGWWWHDTPDVIPPYVLSKKEDVMSRETSSDCVCCLMAMKACHVWHHPTACVTQGPWRHSTPYVVRSCVLCKGYDNKPRPMSFDTVCFSRAMMTHLAWCRPTMCVFQGRWWHCHAKCPTVSAAKRPWLDTMLNVVQLCVLSKGNDGMPCSMSSKGLCKTRGNVKFNGKKSFLSQNLLSNIEINIVKCITRIFQIPKSVFFYQFRSNNEI